MRALLLTVGFCVAACAPYPPAAPQSPRPGTDRVVGTGEVCGGMMGLVCGEARDICRMPMEAQCGAADHTGVCAPRPEICTQQYQPVCGCDGRTYPNECTAHGAGVSAAYAGECRA